MEYIICVKDDEDINIDDFYKIISSRTKIKMKLSNTIMEKINKSRKTVDDLVNNNKIAYGITTGFGSLKDKFISKDQLDQLQYNLIVQTAVGTGEPISIELVRGIVFLKILALSKGHSGVRLEIIEKLIEMLEKNYIPFIPSQGSLGASGDLVPLSHLVYGMMGMGKAYDAESKTYIDADIVMEKLNINPITLISKEGLALINGTQFITSIAAYCLYHMDNIMTNTIDICAMTIEALHANHQAFDHRIHSIKNHNGQKIVAQKIWDLLRPNDQPSDIYKTYVENNKNVQDAYSLRCIPQILGPIYETFVNAERIIINEINSVSDNPLIFDDEILSGGNFHGLYVAMEMDKICIALSHLCNLCERLIDRMVNRHSNGFLPSFLIKNPGINGGLMIPQYVAAGLTAENRHLSNPASVHNIPTCENIEDIVPMGGHAVTKALQSINNTYKILAIFQFVACQALDFTVELPAFKIYQSYKKIREYVPHIENDTYMKNYIDNIKDTMMNKIN